MDQVQYIEARDKVIAAIVEFDDPIPHSEKTHYRKLLLEHIIDMFGTWKTKNDCVPALTVERRADGRAIDTDKCTSWRYEGGCAHCALSDECDNPNKTV